MSKTTALSLVLGTALTLGATSCVFHDHHGRGHGHGHGGHDHGASVSVPGASVSVDAHH